MRRGAINYYYKLKTIIVKLTVTVATRSSVSFFFSFFFVFCCCFFVVVFFECHEYCIVGETRELWRTQTYKFMRGDKTFVASNAC